MNMTRTSYRGYDIISTPNTEEWWAWILDRDTPEGRVTGPSSAEAIAAAKREIDRRGVLGLNRRQDGLAESGRTKR